MREAIVLGFAALALLALTGCESTIDQARKIAAQGERAIHQKGITVTRVDKKVRVLESAIVQDANGTAVVIELRNTGAKPMVDAPIAIDVRDRSGKSVFKNNSPGLEPDLVHVPILLPGHVFEWVNDQVLAAGKPARVLARVGAGKPAPASLPAIQITSTQLVNDPASGWTATGSVRNASSVTQLHLVLFAVARRAGRIVAAGRAIVTRLLPAKTTTFHLYFIGNPQGTQVSVTAPPSTLGS
jgi:hypothetical protein